MPLPAAVHSWDEWIDTAHSDIELGFHRIREGQSDHTSALFYTIINEVQYEDDGLGREVFGPVQLTGQYNCRCTAGSQHLGGLSRIKNEVSKK